MKSVAATCLCLSALLLVVVHRRGRAARPEPSRRAARRGPERSPRGAQGGPARRGGGRAKHEADLEPAEAGGLFRSRRAGRHADPAGARSEPAAAAAARSERAGRPRAGEHARLRELGSRVQRQPCLHGQLPRLHDVRHRAAEQAEAERVGRVPRRAGRHLGPRQPPVHVGGADARAARLRRAGDPDAGQRRAFPRRPHLRHQRSEQAEAGGRGADLPRIAHAHAGDRSERQGEPVRLRIRHGRRAIGRGARRDAPG